MSKAPIRSSEEIKIVGANVSDFKRAWLVNQWKMIGDADRNLRVVVSTPVGHSRCELLHDTPNPIIPEKSDLQGVLIWLISGKMNPSPLADERAMVISAAALLGHYLKQKSFTALVPSAEPTEKEEKP